MQTLTFLHLQEKHDSFSDINQNSSQKSSHSSSTTTVTNWLISPTNSAKGERKKSATMLEIEKNHSLFLEQQGKYIVHWKYRKLSELSPLLELSPI